jgi:hypothetical protein
VLLLLFFLLLLTVMFPASPMQLEGVCAIAVCGVTIQVLGQVDDHDGLKGAFLQVGSSTTWQGLQCSGR